MTEQTAYLSSGSTVLRGFREQDLEALAGWWDNPAVTELLEMGARPTRPKELADFWQLCSARDDCVVFAICERNSGNVIGTCGLYQISWIARRAQFNILIGEPSVWDQGHGTRSTELSLSYAFDTLNLESVHLGVNAENVRAMRSYERAGFVKEGVRRRFVYRNGRYYDSVMYSILRNEFDAGRTANGEDKS